jgi:uncharacterized protein
MIPLRERLLFFPIIATVTVLRPAKSLYPRFWKQLFGQVLYGAAFLGSVRIARFLLWLYPDVEARENTGQSTSLMAAATQGHIEVVRYLLARGADVNACNEFGVTALMRSAEKSNMELTKLLLNSGAEVNARTKFGETAFMEAAKAGQNDMMQLLLDHGADMFALMRSSMDALIWSAGLGKMHTVEYLIQHGMSVAGKRGQTALMLAKKNKHSQIVTLLRQAGVTDPA